MVTVVGPHTVSYSGNGNTGGVAPTDTMAYGTGATVRSLTKTGYTFAGWNTQPTASGTAYYAGNTLTVGTSSVTLYAQWTTTPTHVIYNGNGNTGGTKRGPRRWPSRFISSNSTGIRGAQPKRKPLQDSR